MKRDEMNFDFLIALGRIYVPLEEMSVLVSRLDLEGYNYYFEVERAGVYRVEVLN